MGGSSSNSEVSPKSLHIAFFPLMSPGHFLPMIDMAHMFASHGVISTIITTPSNAATIPPMAAAQLSNNKYLNIITIPFPPPELTQLPPTIENLAQVPSSLFTTFTASLTHFQPSLSLHLSRIKPDCLISDSLFPWTADLANQLSIPRLIFHGAGAFPLFMTTAIFGHFPLDESKPSFVVDGLPADDHKITLYTKGLPELFQDIPFVMKMAEGEAKSYGVVVNTYREMEPSYVDFLKEKPYGGEKSKTWCVGPVSLWNKSEEAAAVRGGGKLETKEKIISWLDGKQQGSVIYLCFGSLCHFSARQLKEMAVGLEMSGKNFIWVVRKEAEGDEAEEKEWMPDQGYEERVADRGLVVRGWAPQTVILEHKATGWFVTHCGWNSVQEAVCAGVLVVTWPLFHEQFINAELVVEVMGIGVRMWEGFRRDEAGDGVVVTAEELAEVVGRVMHEGGNQEEHEEVYEGMRRKVRELAEMAKMAVEEPGGSSYRDVVGLIRELKEIATANKD